jgi:secreted trypsin-like serine protease
MRRFHVHALAGRRAGPARPGAVPPESAALRRAGRRTPWPITYRRPMTAMHRLAAFVAALGCAAVAATPAAATSTQDEIVGGFDAPASSWPSIAYLEGSYHDDEGTEHVFACTGSVVAPRWIVTAGHCTLGDGSQPPERMTATLGVSDYNDPAGERIAVDRFVPYPSYDTGTEIGDIGLLHLASATSRPVIPLATTSGDSAGDYSSPANVPNAAGWGAIDEDGTQFTTQLQQAYLEVRSKADCSALIDTFDAATQTCAGTSGSTGACHGDSGGPLVEMDSATGAPVLWGLTAYGPQVTAGLAPCSVDLPTVFTWIPAYTNFIQSTIADDADASSASAPAAAPAAATPAAQPVTRTRTAACKDAHAAMRAARKRERAALRRLRAARHHRTGTTGQRHMRRARHRYRAARDSRRRLERTAARRCRA